MVANNEERMCASELLRELTEDVSDVMMKMGWIAEIICKENCNDNCED